MKKDIRGNSLELKPLSLWQKLFWSILPNKCVLCGEWKLWGKQPHKICELYELSR